MEINVKQQHAIDNKYHIYNSHVNQISNKLIILHVQSNNDLNR